MYIYILGGAKLSVYDDVVNSHDKEIANVAVQLLVRQKY